jgi:signal recognition particle subunit SRP54
MAMFDAVRQGFQSAINLFEGKREITEENIDEALKKIRMSLFEADVNYRVVKSFLKRVKEKALGEIVHVRAKHEGESVKIDPGDAFIKICHDELEDLMGPVDTSLNFAKDHQGPTIIMMVGLQGAGKTTTSGKLARWVMHHHDKKPMLVAGDVYRPAAIDQLKVLGEKLEIPVYSEEGGNPPDIAEKAVQYAKDNDRDVVIIDTAGRLAVDDLLMTELEEIVGRVNPHNIMLIVDAMIGQDAVTTAKEFNDRLELDGFMMTKLDGDARGGAALSIKEITGKPIKFVGMGESMDALQAFQPAGFADRILGMGDIRSLVGRMENIIDEKEAAEREQDAKRMLQGDFDFYDFLEQIKMIRKMGSLTDLLDMMPFGNQLGAAGANVDDYELVRIESMINSMTPDERSNPTVVNEQVTRQRRIAKGSGRKLDEVRDLLQRFSMMRDMLSQFGDAQGGGGLMSKIPGMKQLSQMRQMKNMDMSQLMNAMGGDAGGGGNPFAQGGGGGGGNQPQLPKGFSVPGQRQEPSKKATKASKKSKAQIKKEKEKRRRRRRKRKRNK